MNPATTLRTFSLACLFVSAASLPDHPSYGLSQNDVLFYAPFNGRAEAQTAKGNPKRFSFHLAL